MKDVIGDYDPDRVKFLVCQDVEDEIEAGTAIVKELCAYASQFHRQPCDASLLTIGLKCGGSDGFSGITANPLVGEISNRLIAAGGTSILTEVPEMFGAEKLLMNRARNQEVFDKTVGLINHFKEYFMSYGEKSMKTRLPATKPAALRRWKTSPWAVSRKAAGRSSKTSWPMATGQRRKASTCCRHRGTI